MALHVRGVVLPEGEVRDIYLVGDRVTYEPVAGAETISDSGYILPGLADAHCHPGIAHGPRPITGLDEAREQAGIDRDAGVLAIRDAGSPYPYPELENEPGIPRLARAGRHVAAPRRYLRDIAVEVDGVADVTAAVTAEAKAGNGWVKLVGDWIDRGAGDLGPSWDAGTMTAAVQAAHAAGARAAVHTFSEAGVEIMVKAGVDSVEHGTGLSFDLIDEMGRRGIALVPTMINVATFGDIADQAEAKFPGYAEHMRALRDRFPEVVRAAYEAGVPVYVGTDAGGTIRHGRAADEILALHEEAGFPALDALAAASWGARAWLGFPGLVEGGLADLVVYPADPRADLRVVRAPRRIVLRGQVVL
jgi:imidazolonepropionase-like amidohydrolase